MDIRVNVESIKENLGTNLKQEFDIFLEDMLIQGREVSFENPAKLDITIINSNKEYIVMGHVKLRAVLPCSRCLEEFFMPLEFDFNFELSKEEIVDDEINVGEGLLKELRLAFPMQAVCNEECKGLCPSCGNNLNREDCDCFMHKVDPRLAKLQKLLKEDK
jgi:uncharacterized protein